MPHIWNRAPTPAGAAHPGGRGTRGAQAGFGRARPFGTLAARPGAAPGADDETVPHGPVAGLVHRLAAGPDQRGDAAPGARPRLRLRLGRGLGCLLRRLPVGAGRGPGGRTAHRERAAGAGAFLRQRRAARVPRVHVPARCLAGPRSSAPGGSPARAQAPPERPRRLAPGLHPGPGEPLEHRLLAGCVRPGGPAHGPVVVPGHGLRRGARGGRLEPVPVRGGARRSPLRDPPPGRSPPRP
jgi:hypothetical protein